MRYHHRRGGGVADSGFCVAAGVAAQQREAKLLEENAAYEKEITKCEAKIQEKLQEAEQFQQKLKELDSIEENLKTELQRVQAASSASQSEKSVQLTEEKIQMLEKKWADVQEKALKQPSPAQREKALDKQLHSLMEQLAAKQAQAEALINEIHIKEKELERLNALWRRVENTKEATAARNRFAKSGPTYGYETDTDLDSQSNLPYHSGGRSEYRQRLRILRSSGF
uniref:Uncharacterized protein n=1 Tax=Chenopodium quinoa TaxID=63459 RepID=A0A803LKQ7_CHEQI